MVAKTQLLFSLAICLLPTLLVQGQSATNDSTKFGEIKVADARANESAPESWGGRSRSILAHETHNENNLATTDVAPPYTGLIASRVGQLSVDWVTPKSIMIGQEVDFELVVRNRGPVAAQEIQIEPLLPEGSQLVRSDPAPRFIDKKTTWQISNLDPQEEVRITLSLILHSVGSAKTDARITYSTSTSTTVSVVEPMLEVKVEGPDSTVVGDNLFFHVIVSNPGTGPTENTALKVIFPEGINRVAESADYDIGVLGPGKSRTIVVPGNIAQLGEQTCEFVVTSAHDLRDATSKTVRGLGAKIDCSIEGPALRYVNRPASYSMRIVNNGTAPASNVSIRCDVPRPFAFLKADFSGTYDAVHKNITWFVERLDPDQELVVEFQLQATTPGSVPILAEVVAERDLRATAKHQTEVKGIAGILVEVVDVADPIEIGVDTFYEIIVTNQGTAFARDVLVTAEVPVEMEITGSQGPSEGSIDGQMIRFAKLPKLAPRADAIYRVNVRGLQAKDVRIRVLVDAESLDAPVVELESTKVYQD